AGCRGRAFPCPRLRLARHGGQVARGRRGRATALWRPARLAVLDGAAHHGAHRLSQPPGGPRLLDLQLRVLPPRLAPHHPRGAARVASSTGAHKTLLMATTVHPPRRSPVGAGPDPTSLRGFFGVFRYSRRALELVWSTSRRLTLTLAILTLVAGVLPALVAYVGSLIVDAVVFAMRADQGGA